MAQWPILTAMVTMNVFFPSWFYYRIDSGGMYLIDYEPQNDVLQINANHVNIILDEPNSLLHASSFDIDGNGILTCFPLQITVMSSVLYRLIMMPETLHYLLKLFS